MTLNCCGLKSKDFLKYLKHSVQNAFDFQGRASKQEYLVFLLAMILYTFIASNLISVGSAIGSLAIQWGPKSILFKALGALAYLTTIFYALYTLFSFFVLAWTVSVGVRRLHDMGKSGWWLILIYFGIGIGVFLIYMLFEKVFMMSKIENPSGYLFLSRTLLSTAFQYAFLYLILIRPDSDKKNAYGPPPSYD